MNPLILLFKLNKKKLFPYRFYLVMGLRAFGLYFTNRYSGFCICVYSIQRYSESGLASEMFLEVSRSFHMAMFDL